MLALETAELCASLRFSWSTAYRGLPSRRRRHPRAFGAEIHSLWGVLHPAREASRKAAHLDLAHVGRRTDLLLGSVVDHVRDVEGVHHLHPHPFDLGQQDGSVLAEIARDRARLPRGRARLPLRRPPRLPRLPDPARAGEDHPRPSRAAVHRATSRARPPHRWTGRGDLAGRRARAAAVAALRADTGPLS